MNESQTINTLTPSLSRAFVRVLLLVLATGAVAAVMQRYSTGHWWSADYFASLTIPVLLMPTFVCLMFVPRRIQWSATEFELQPRFGRARTLPWTQLYAYGTGRGVFLLQFRDVHTFQIFAAAFDRDQWQALRDFLAANHPDKKASFWLGPKAIRK